MKKISDEVLNKYIDGDLSSEEKGSIQNLLLTDKELNLRLSALQKIHRELKQIKEDRVSAAFTRKVMLRITNRYKVPKEQKLFISIVLSFIGILCSIFVGYILINIAGELSETVTSGTSETVNNYSQNLVQSIVSFLSGMNISVFGSILSIVLLVSGYFFFEMSKQSKTNLSS